MCSIKHSLRDTKTLKIQTVDQDISQVGDPASATKANPRKSVENVQKLIFLKLATIKNSRHMRYRVPIRRGT